MREGGRERGGREGWMADIHILVGMFNSNPIRLMHESAISSHYQWLPRCRSNIGIGNVIVVSFCIQYGTRYIT